MSVTMMAALEIQVKSLDRQLATAVARVAELTEENARVRGLLTEYDLRHDADQAALSDAAPVSAGAVKPLVWEEYGECFSWKAPLFGAILVKRHWKGHWVVVWSTPGYSEVFVPGHFDRPEDAKAAAEARILSAIETPVSAWQGIDSAKPPKDRPFLARNPGFAAFIAEWSDVDEEYIHDSGVDGWICLYFSHWMEIPDLSPAPPSTKEGGA